jgi:hypothetical protein
MIVSEGLGRRVTTHDSCQFFVEEEAMKKLRLDPRRILRRVRGQPSDLIPGKVLLNLLAVDHPLNLPLDSKAVA